MNEWTMDNRQRGNSSLDHVHGNNRKDDAMPNTVFVCLFIQCVFSIFSMRKKERERRKENGTYNGYVYHRLFFFFRINAESKNEMHTNYCILCYDMLGMCSRFSVQCSVLHRNLEHQMIFRTPNIIDDYVNGLQSCDDHTRTCLIVDFLRG